MDPSLLSWLMQQIFSAAGLAGCLLFAGLIYQTWRIERRERLGEIDRRQAASEANDRSVAFLGLTDALQRSAQAQQSSATAQQLMDAKLASIDAKLSRIEGMMTTGRR